MRNVDVYGKAGSLRVFIDGEEVHKVTAVNPPTRENFANVVLHVDGKVTFHGDVKPPEPLPTQAPYYRWEVDYQRLIERLTVLAQKGKISQKDYDDLLKGLSSI